tara:strand:+ start:95 stop:286 length:192 start_codon:yes stop_codon:yes gene_type:complete
MKNLKFKTYKGTNIISWDFGNYKSCGKRFMVAYTNGKPVVTFNQLYQAKRHIDKSLKNIGEQA